MREIKFRGKRKDNGEWIYGQLVNKKCIRDNGMPEIYLKTWEEVYAYIYEDNFENNIEEYPTKFIEVIPETIGQYTGLKDKNGKEIYEGDIVKLGTYTKGVVEYSDKYAQFIIINTNTIEYEYEPLGDYTKIEKIGNKWDNPELLEEGE